MSSMQRCYNVTLRADPTSRLGYVCDSIDPDTENTRPLEFLPQRPDGGGGTLTITSPDFGTQMTYPTNRLCLYGIPQCQDARDIHYISWRTETFELAEPGDFLFLDNICSDLVELITPSDPEKLENGGAVLRDFQAKTLCGDQGNFNDTNSGPGLRVRRYS